jgi:hypothetical protein
MQTWAHVVFPGPKRRRRVLSKTCFSHSPCFLTSVRFPLDSDWNRTKVGVAGMDVSDS